MSDDPTIEDVLLKWENGEETNEVMQAVISAHDAATKEQKALVPEKTLRRLDLAASKLSLARKKAAEKVVAFPDFRVGGRMDDKEIEGMVAELAGFSAADYDRQRDAAATKAGIRKSTLDGMVKAAQKAMPEPDKSKLVPRQPWATAVKGDELVDDLIADLTRYVIISPDCAAATVFWVLHTYLVNYTFITPRLFITAPQRGCGKSTLVDWLTTVVQKPLSSVNISAASVYHIVEDDQPTIIIDEADTFLKLKEELRGILNSGHKKGGYVHRQDARTGGKTYSTFSAVALSLIGNLPSTLQDRSIRIRLRRRTPDEKITSLRLDKVGDDFARRCARWVLDNEGVFTDADPAIPAELFNRVEDNWRPLLALADIVGDWWPERLRQVAVRIAALDAGEDVSAETQFLRDLRGAFGDEEWLATNDLLRGLRQQGDYPLLSGKALANRLKPYDIKPDHARRGNATERGYWARDFAETWKRYVPDVPDVPAADEQVEEVDDVSEPVLATGTSGTSGTLLRGRKL
jgi:putative DNA primase/helicase